MTELIYPDDQTFEHSAADVRVFGKWSGTEIQISDMSLEVNRDRTDSTNQHSTRITSSERNNRNFFLTPPVVIK